MSKNEKQYSPIEYSGITGAFYESPPCAECAALRAELLERAEYSDDQINRLSRICSETLNLIRVFPDARHFDRIRALHKGLAKWFARTTNGE